MTIPEQLMEILVCPLCKNNVVLSAQGDALDCTECRLRFPVRDGIPVMLVEEAEDIS